CMQALHLPYSF
nr:immunoglobulin light chain junction region [Macaca mulatta]MOW74615.1 immunoglobulin light chain junction region [Macaca mulatta]